MYINRNFAYTLSDSTNKYKTTLYSRNFDSAEHYKTYGYLQSEKEVLKKYMKILREYTVLSKVVWF